MDRKFVLEIFVHKFTIRMRGNKKRCEVGNFDIPDRLHGCGRACLQVNIFT